MKPTTDLPETAQQPIHNPLWFKVRPMKTINGRSTTFNRVLVVDNQGIMGAGLEKLISADQAIEVLGIVVPDEPTLVQEIWRIQPDIIILISESEVISPCQLLERLGDYGRLRIILVSENSNVMDVYDKQQITARNQDSLLAQLKPE
jgi:chemotaxis response regulator CheB